MVIRVLAVPDYLDLASFDEIFCTLLGWDGLVGFSIASTARSSPAFSAGAKRIGKRCGIFDCGLARHFSTRVEASIFGNGSSGFSTPRWEVTGMMCRYAWQAEVRLRRRTVAAPRVID
jgi:hypothetical protein